MHYCWGQRVAKKEHCKFDSGWFEPFQVQDYYPNEMKVVVPVCLNSRWCSSESVRVVSY